MYVYIIMADHICCCCTNTVHKTLLYSANTLGNESHTAALAEVPAVLGHMRAATLPTSQARERKRRQVCLASRRDRQQPGLRASSVP